MRTLADIHVRGRSCVVYMPAAEKDELSSLITCPIMSPAQKVLDPTVSEIGEVATMLVQLMEFWASECLKKTGSDLVSA